MTDFDRQRDYDRYARRRDFDDDQQQRAGRSGEDRSWRGQDDHDFEPQQVGARGYGYGPRRYAEGPRQAGDYRRDFSHAGYDRGYGGRSDPDRGYRAGPRRDYGHENERAGRGDWSYADHGYAPGAQIWGQSDRGVRHANEHDFEPDYLHWREQQLANFDNDYRTWRDERRTKFTNDFDSWRRSRSDNVKAEAANPYVGDVAEGGVGRVTTKADDRNKQ